ncbi:Panacea domain-containing protein [Sphingomonas tabacisoli]|uniref:Panacea domain-containing protein n=1 Tax=Sphingomonas tabacisoli TaxID=2249466 RepID=A0ABW4HZT5_9SPHN
MPKMQPWYNARKAAQVSAFFAAKQGGTIPVLKLTKLLYLADRKNLQKYDFPITWDNLVSMDHGPVNSITYDCINGMRAANEDWEEFITDRAAYSVGITKPINVDQLDQLSDAEVETLEETWAEFGHMTKWQIRDWTHANCPEWEDPNGSSYPIPFNRLLKFLGKQDANELEADLLAERTLKAAFA